MYQRDGSVSETRARREALAWFRNASASEATFEAIRTGAVIEDPETATARANAPVTRKSKVRVRRPALQ